MKPLYIALPLALLAGGWLLYLSKKPADTTPALSDVSSVEEVSNTDRVARNPLAPVPENQASNSLASTSNSISDSPQGSRVPESAATPRPSRDDIDLTALAAAPLTDAEFTALENRIRKDPTLLTDILAEYRYNTDPVRAKRLAALIGKLKDPQILATAIELAYSSDYSSKKNGLELLSRLQPHNSEARDAGIELLGIEADPAFLVATMDVLATPAANATDSQKQLLLDNVLLLSTHNEASVRAHSISLLGRWAKNSEAVIPSLTAGLNDSSDHVRARAATALIGTARPNPEMINNLFVMLENKEEVKSTRETAMLALQRMQLSQQLQSRFLQAQRALRTRQLTQ